MESQDSNVTEEDIDTDSECEYEYHATETETFYVTLDLESAESMHGKRKENRRKETKTKLSTVESITPATGANPPPSDPPPITDKGEHEIQLLEFQSASPLVSYRGQIYSCIWGDTLGTDLILCAPDLALPDKPVLAGKGFWIAARSVVKLLGTKIDLKKKKDFVLWKDPLDLGPSVEDEMLNDSLLSRTWQSPNIYLDSYHGSSTRSIDLFDDSTRSEPARQSQAQFLERFIEAKKDRGEQDEHLVRQAGSEMRSEDEDMEDLMDINDLNLQSEIRRGNSDFPAEDRMDVDGHVPNLSSRAIDSIVPISEVFHAGQDALPQRSYESLQLAGLFGNTALSPLPFSPRTNFSGRSRDTGRGRGRAASTSSLASATYRSRVSGKGRQSGDRARQERQKIPSQSPSVTHDIGTVSEDFESVRVQIAECNKESEDSPPKDIEAYKNTTVEENDRQMQ